MHVSIQEVQDAIYCTQGRLGKRGKRWWSVLTELRDAATLPLHALLLPRPMYWDQALWPSKSPPRQCLINSVTD